MKKLLLMVVLTCGLFINGALATTNGFIFTNVIEPVAVSSLTTYSKTAAATNYSILYLIGFGDAGVENIAKNNGITKIKHVDKHTISFLYFFNMETFTVYGD